MTSRRDDVMADFDAIYEDPPLGGDTLSIGHDDGDGSPLAPPPPLVQEPVVIRGAGNITV